MHEGCRNSVMVYTGKQILIYLKLTVFFSCKFSKSRYFQQMVEDPLQLLRIKCVADEQGDGVLGELFSENFP